MITDLVQYVAAGEAIRAVAPVVMTGEAPTTLIRFHWPNGDVTPIVIMKVGQA